MSNHKDVLLRAAYDLLKRSDEGPYVQETMAILVKYDGTNCDGSCLMDDIACALEIDGDTPPIPLEDDDENTSCK